MQQHSSAHLWEVLPPILSIHPSAKAAEVGKAPNIAMRFHVCAGYFASADLRDSASGFLAQIRVQQRSFLILPSFLSQFLPSTVLPFPAHQRPHHHLEVILPAAMLSPSI